MSFHDDDMADDQGDHGGLLRRLTIAGVSVLVVVLMVLDVSEDLRDGAGLSHVAAEVFVICAALAVAIVVIRRLTVAALRVRGLEHDLAIARQEAAKWRREAREALDGLGVAIAHQFERWALTPAEAEIGLLLLKGLSHKDVAGIRNTNERTVRHQALAIYRKSGLAGRAELSAFFLEDLLLPKEQQERREGSGPRDGLARPGID